jgi:hypothetical protein
MRKTTTRTLLGTELESGSEASAEGRRRRSQYSTITWSGSGSKQAQKEEGGGPSTPRSPSASPTSIRMAAVDRVSRKIKQGKVEIDYEDYALLVNYDLEMVRARYYDC